MTLVSVMSAGLAKDPLIARLSLFYKSSMKKAIYTKKTAISGLNRLILAMKKTVWYAVPMVKVPILPLISLIIKTSSIADLIKSLTFGALTIMVMCRA